MRFLIVIYFEGALVFHKVEYNVVDNNGGWGSLNTHLMTIFLKLFNIVDENEFSNNFLKLFRSHHHISPIVTISLSIIIKWHSNLTLILGQQIRMVINKFEFIYLLIMHEFHPMIYLFNPNHKWNSSMKNDIHPCEIIHLWTYSSM
jgi:hypothetical protein